LGFVQNGLVQIVYPKYVRKVVDRTSLVNQSNYTLESFNQTNYFSRSWIRNYLPTSDQAVVKYHVNTVQDLRHN